jgi:hypothetical protein
MSEAPDWDEFVQQWFRFNRQLALGDFMHRES